MKPVPSSLYSGEVVHVRVWPKRHVLSMKLFNLYINVDELPALSRQLWLFGYNRFSLFSIADRKWATRQARPISSQIRQLAEDAAGLGSAARIFMLCFPALLGKVFNPLTTYYCFDAQGELSCMVFEVSNTFGQRHSYVVPAEVTGRGHQKHFHVSPFNKVEGDYHFHVSLPSENLRLGVSLHQEQKLILNTWFTGERRDLTDWVLLKAFIRMPLLPLQVLGAIHWEALKLWLKGLRIHSTPAPPDSSYSVSARTSRSMR